MGVTFSAFEIGRRALHASQMGIAVAGQNIANVNTPGYTRQSVLLASAQPVGTRNLQIGTGVDIVGINQFRDRFLEQRLETETGIAGRLTSQRDALMPVDGAFNESEGYGISASISNFFNAFRALEANPVSLPLRSDVIIKANAMTGAFVNTRARLVTIRTEVDQRLRSEVDRINDLSQQVAAFNKRISIEENSRHNASELRDQRSELVKQITELTGARAVETADSMISLSLADGQQIVTGEHVNLLQTQSLPPDSLAGIFMNGQPAAIGDGSIKGFLNAITEITGQITSLDDLAASITARVNGLHKSGTDLNGNPGLDFFLPQASGPVTAALFQVNPPVKNDAKLVVASRLIAGSSSATVAGAIANLLTDPTSTAGTRTGSFSTIYASIVSDAGNDLRTVEDALTTQQVIMSQALAQRDGVSGVSLDEEAVSLLQFQRSYEAAARFLKIADEMTQTILSLAQ